MPHALNDSGAQNTFNPQSPLAASARLSDVLKRPGVSYAALRECVPELPALSSEASELTETELRQKAYFSNDKGTDKVKRQRQILSFHHLGSI